MIIGILLRNYKIYQNINYIPLSAGETFCGIVGVNGIGKSSILESLDTFFNYKPWIWNLASRKQGQQAKPYIVPIFLIEKSKIPAKESMLAEAISKVMWNIEEKDVSPNNKGHFETFNRHRNSLLKRITPKDYYLLPIGKDIDGDLSFSIFNRYKIAVALGIDNKVDENMSIKQEDLKSHLGANNLLNVIISLYEYLYIPKDIDPSTFMKLEKHEIQVLMGQTLSQVIEKNLPGETVRNINRGLLQFLDNLSKDLRGYSFRKRTDRQSGLRKGDFNSLIIEHFFEARKFHKQEGGHWIEIKDLSSGEKQKAIIDLAFSLLTNHRGSSDNLIIAIDEPESSLHISSCFEQFLRLFAISVSCQQLLFSTHWYGFFPTIDNGFVSVINRKEGVHIIDIVSLNNYREEIKQQKVSSKGKLPYDIRLKSINDFSQSIISSLISEHPFNWIICEGSSEKLYLDYYLNDLVKEKNLRIIPVGGAAEIKRIYNYLSTAYDDFKDDVKGKIYMISDTDKQLVKYTTQDQNNLLCKRIMNDENNKKTVLEKIDSVIASPPTEIEDCLNGRLFHETLLYFKASNTELSFVADNLKEEYELNSYFYLDMRPTEKVELDNFFNKGNNKWEFAKKYLEYLALPHNTPEEIKKAHSKDSIPSWINDIRTFFTYGRKKS
ncbi:MAG: ATP-binding protein [Chitinophaga sp.]|uniref:AAA family ATPase n=1 Tax=Chitinophaga sp. TaxID=1869181 RepID=UPI0025BF7100|nr:AAA family ATPase [Chitinophaga sp.]MBV8253138.1 ATP-binding protein [Chitinophaga sp.]